MGTKHKNNLSAARALLFVVILIGGVGAYIMHFLKGTNVSLLNPMGSIAEEQANLMYLVVAIVLIVAVPTLVLLYFIAWRYRAANNRATYAPGFNHGRMFVFNIWAIPTLAMLVLAIIMVPITQRLDPKKPIDNGREPITIQVIALRWKWLFLYPEHQVATVNNISIPKNQPVTFELTADDAPMTSFWIPNIGGQLYAMTGHVNRLNLMATEIGNYNGATAEINGPGFAGMRFTARVTNDIDFENWVKDLKKESNKLDSATYANLRKPSENEPAARFSAYTPDLYNKVIMKYMGNHSDHNNNSSSKIRSNKTNHGGYTE